MIRTVRLGVRVGALVVAAVVAYLAVTYLQVRAAAGRDEAVPSQAIVVFGAAQFNGRPSPVLKARLDHAADLYHRQVAPVVVVTGGRQAGDRFTEATASASYLALRGVPNRRLLREVAGRSSWDSLAAAATFMRARGIHEVVLVSDPFHSFRIKAMAGELGLRGHPSATSTSPITGMRAQRYMARETLAVAVGRIIGYRREAGVKRVSERVRQGVGSG